MPHGALMKKYFSFFFPTNNSDVNDCPIMPINICCRFHCVSLMPRLTNQSHQTSPPLSSSLSLFFFFIPSQELLALSSSQVQESRIGFKICFTESLWSDRAPVRWQSTPCCRGGRNPVKFFGESGVFSFEKKNLAVAVVGWWHLKVWWSDSGKLSLLRCKAAVSGGTRCLKMVLWALLLWDGEMSYNHVIMLWLALPEAVPFGDYF